MEHYNPLLTGLESPEKQAEALAMVLKQQLTVRQTEALCKKLAKAPRRRRETLPPPLAGEVEAALRDTVIVAKSAGEGLGVSLLHWIIGDSQRSIVVEMMADGLHVYDDPVDTLANQPTFPWHMENLRTYITATSDFPQTATWRGAELKPYGAGAGMRGIPGDCYSPSRFVKAAYLNANYPQKESETENVVRMFRSLEGVVMIEGASRMGDGKFEKTIYTGCFSARTGNYYYAMYGDPSIRYVSLMDAEGASPDRLVVPEPRRS